MKKTSEKSPNRWFIMFFVFLTLVFFLFLLLQNSTPNSPKLTLPPAATNEPSLKNHSLAHKGILVNKDQLNAFIREWIRRYLESGGCNPIGSGVQLGDKKIKSVQVIGKSFLVYEAKIVPAPKGFVLNIIMDLPDLKIEWEGENCGYQKFYPLLNPYIHVVELEYQWIWTDEPSFTLSMSNMDIQMVDWASNQYHKNYKDTKNSPLYKMPIPEPRNWTREELSGFLRSLGLFQTLTVVQTDLSLVQLDQQQQTVVV